METFPDLAYFGVGWPISSWEVDSDWGMLLEWAAQEWGCLEDGVLQSEVAPGGHGVSTAAQEVREVRTQSKEGFRARVSLPGIPLPGDVDFDPDIHEIA